MSESNSSPSDSSESDDFSVGVWRLEFPVSEVVFSTGLGRVSLNWRKLLCMMLRPEKMNNWIERLSVLLCFD